MHVKYKWLYLACCCSIFEDVIKSSSRSIELDTCKLLKSSFHEDQTLSLGLFYLVFVYFSPLLSPTPLPVLQSRNLFLKGTDAVNLSGPDTKKPTKIFVLLIFFI